MGELIANLRVGEILLVDLCNHFDLFVITLAEGRKADWLATAARSGEHSRSLRGIRRYYGCCCRPRRFCRHRRPCLLLLLLLLLPTIALNELDTEYCTKYNIFTGFHIYIPTTAS